MGNLQPVYDVTPVGRLVQGDAFQGNTKDMQGRERRSRAGNLYTEFFQRIAIPKGPEWDRLWGVIHAKALLDFPNGAHGEPTFAWKVLDGDLPQNVTKPGWAGCWVLKCTSGFPPRVFANTTPAQEIVDPSQCKRGDYVMFSISIVGNEQPPTANGGKPGMMIGCSVIRQVAYGEPISTGPNPDDLFGAPTPMPVGGSATPIAAGPMPANPAAPLAAAPPAAPPAAAPPAAPPSALPPQPGTMPAAPPPAPAGPPGGAVAQPPSTPPAPPQAAYAPPPGTAAPLPASVPAATANPGFLAPGATPAALPASIPPGGPPGTRWDGQQWAVADIPF